jgi:hypothetical protein
MSDFEFKTIWLSSKTEREHPVIITVDFDDISDDWDTRPHYLAELSITWDGENIYNIVPPEDLEELAKETKDFYEAYADDQKRCNEDDFIDPKHIDSWNF